MRIILLTLAAFVFSIPAALAQADLSECSVKINFGSYAMGIDTDGYTAIREIIDNSKEVDTYTDISWGREGERTICVQTYSMQASDALYNDLLRHVPNRSETAWTEIIHEDGRSQKTHWPDNSRTKMPKI